MRRLQWGTNRQTDGNLKKRVSFPLTHPEKVIFKKEKTLRKEIWKSGMNEVISFDVAQDRMNGTSNENRTYSGRLAGLAW